MSRSTANMSILTCLDNGAMKTGHTFLPAFSSTKLSVVRYWVNDPIPSNVLEVDFEIMKAASVTSSRALTGSTSFSSSMVSNQLNFQKRFLKKQSFLSVSNPCYDLRINVILIDEFINCEGTFAPFLRTCK